MKNLYFDASVLQHPTFRGVHIYAWNLLREMARLDRQVTFHLHFGMSGWHPKIDELLDESNVRCHRWPGVMGRHLVPIAEILRTRSTVYCLLNGNSGRLRVPVPCKTAAVFHDLRLIYFPELYGSAESAAFTRLAKKWMPKLDLVITGSQTVKSEIHEYFGLPDERVVVVSEGCDHSELRGPEVASTEGLCFHFPYFLTVNPSDIRKNLFRILDAFCLYSQTYSTDEHVKLVIAGVVAESERFSNWLSDHPESRERVVALDYVSDRHLNDLYRNAIASIYVSAYEGFGIPIIESFKNDCPVIVSDIPVFNEVAGNAGIFVDPTDRYSVCAAMRSIREDLMLRQKSIDLGRVRTDYFRWEKSAGVALEALLRL